MKRIIENFYNKKEAKIKKLMEGGHIDKQDRMELILKLTEVKAKKRALRV